MHNVRRRLELKLSNRKVPVTRNTEHMLQAVLVAQIGLPARAAHAHTHLSCPSTFQLGGGRGIVIFAENSRSLNQ